MLLLICLYDAYFNKHGKVCFSIVDSESTFLFRLLSLNPHFFFDSIFYFFITFQLHFYLSHSFIFKFNFSFFSIVFYVFSVLFQFIFNFGFPLFINNFRFIPIKDYLFFRKECLWFRKTKNG